MSIFGIAALAMAAAFCAVALKKYSPEISIVIAIAAGAILLVSILSRTMPVVRSLQQLTDSIGLDPQYGVVLMKTIGICFLCQFTSDACKDAGQNALAAKVELAAKIAVLLLALPLMENILQMTAGWMSHT
ncbi:MAG: stage III sporulation protein AD [Clostridia bacterium]|nr:stage III sporulation protein AD [Clostridia bacterium]HCA54519.1 stage III sporulation protein AD [Oscillospiraceae bacterium]